MIEQSASQVSSKKRKKVNNGPNQTDTADNYDRHATQLQFAFPDTDQKASPDSGGSTQDTGGGQ